MKNYSNNGWLVLLLIVPLLLITSCKKLEFDKIATEAWSPNLAVPLAVGSFGVYDILAKTDSSYLSIGSDGALEVIYNTEKELLNAADLIDLPDQNFSYTGSLATLGIPTVPFFSGSQTVSVNETYGFSSPIGGSLHSIDFRSGNFVIQASSSLMHSVKYVFTFPDLLENGSVVTRTIDLVYTGIVPMTNTSTIDLSNCVLDLSNGAGGANEIRAQVAITITGSGNPIMGTESMDFSLYMGDMDFDLATGDFSGISLPAIQDTIALKLFENSTQGTFTITNPRIDFKFKNSFGIPVDIDFNSIKTKEITSGLEFPLTGFPPSFSLVAASSAGQTAISNLTINDQNSANIQNILSPTPKVLIFDVGTTIPGSSNNFVAHDSKIDLEGTLVLPLEGYAKGFMMRDTVEASVNLDPEFIESAMVRLNVENGFPIEADLRILLVDENYNTLKDLTSGFKNIIKAAPVDGAGKVTQMAKIINDFTLTNSEISQVKNTKYIIFEVGGQTTNGDLSQVVKFYDGYRMNLKLGIQAQAKIKI